MVIVVSLLLQLTGTIVVLLAETAVNDASFLIFKQLRPCPVSPRWQRHGDQLWSLLLGSTSGRWSEGSFMKFRAARTRRGTSASSGETTVCAPPKGECRDWRVWKDRD